MFQTTSNVFETDGKTNQLNSIEIQDVSTLQTTVNDTAALNSNQKTQFKDANNNFS